MTQVVPNGSKATRPTPQVETITVSKFAPFRGVVFTAVNLTSFFILWELIARAGVINPLFFPRSSEVFSALYRGFADGTILPELAHSLTNFLIGLAISAVIGIPVGLLMGASRIADLVLSPYVWAMTSLPRVALIPLLILILGFGDAMQLTIIVLSAVFPIMVNCMAGVKTVDPSLLRAGRVFGTSQWETYVKIILPFTLPFVISGVNQGIARGLVGMLIGELLGGGGNGLGYLLDRAGEQFDAPMLYGVLLLLAVMSVSLIQAMRWLEERAAPWRDITRT
ncbi:MAG TPA: ABC transporter permease subunit [Pseudonocardia sp.]|jgi:ABC-type nitrate/sulfonate/bicarbonate transport system permease component|uniref:ABC transporter permease n=1 Tax=Pseudonocardia sp. TaxID=60912 RepID=UPI002CB36048|nr:ABC transporter permease subunit [Pseudonocardia sp.]HTF46938.1 ABC transporter permease subunit [Pseudonocardia sp.]